MDFIKELNFLKVYWVTIEPSPLGVEITPLIRYRVEEDVMIKLSFSLYQSGERKKWMNLEKTNGKIIESRGFSTFADTGDLTEKVKIVVNMNGEKSIFEFFYKQGEVIPKF